MKQLLAAIKSLFAEESKWTYKNPAPKGLILPEPTPVPGREYASN